MAFEFSDFLSHLSGDQVGVIRRCDNGYFLSHLSGDQVAISVISLIYGFLSHLSGDQDACCDTTLSSSFLSHLSGDQEELYLKKISYNKAWKAKYPNLPSNFHLIITD